MGFWPFDPNLPALRAPLLSALGADPKASDARFEAMRGFHGGLNEGAWAKDEASAAGGVGRFDGVFRPLDRFRGVRCELP